MAEGAAVVAALQEYGAGDLAGKVQQSHFLQSGYHKDPSIHSDRIIPQKNRFAKHIEKAGNGYVNKYAKDISAYPLPPRRAAKRTNRITAKTAAGILAMVPAKYGAAGCTHGPFGSFFTSGKRQFESAWRHLKKE